MHCYEMLADMIHFPVMGLLRMSISWLAMEMYSLRIGYDEDPRRSQALRAGLVSLALSRSIQWRPPFVILNRLLLCGARFTTRKEQTNIWPKYLQWLELMMSAMCQSSTCTTAVVDTSVSP